MASNFRETGAVATGCWNAVRQRLEERQSESFVERRMHKGKAVLIEVADFRRLQGFGEQDDTVFHPQTYYGLPCVGQMLSSVAAGNQKAQRAEWPQPGECCNQSWKIFLRVVAAEIEQVGFESGSEASIPLQRESLNAWVSDYDSLWWLYSCLKEHIASPVGVGQYDARTSKRLDREPEKGFRSAVERLGHDQRRQIMYHTDHWNGSDGRRDGCWAEKCVVASRAESGKACHFPEDAAPRSASPAGNLYSCTLSVGEDLWHGCEQCEVAETCEFGHDVLDVDGDTALPSYVYGGIKEKTHASSIDFWLAACN